MKKKPTTRPYKRYQYETSPRKLEPIKDPKRNPQKPKKTTAKTIKKSAEEIKKAKNYIQSEQADISALIKDMSKKHKEVDELIQQYKQKEDLLVFLIFTSTTLNYIIFSY